MRGAVHVPRIGFQRECIPILAVEGSLDALHRRVLRIDIHTHILRGKRPDRTPILLLMERVVLIGHDARSLLFIRLFGRLRHGKHSPEDKPEEGSRQNAADDFIPCHPTFSSCPADT